MHAPSSLNKSSLKQSQQMYSRKINNVTKIHYTDVAAVMQVSGVPSRRIGANLLESSDGPAPTVFSSVYGIRT
jgi:hypothetical protein